MPWVQGFKRLLVEMWQVPFLQFQTIWKQIPEKWAFSKYLDSVKSGPSKSFKISSWRPGQVQKEMVAEEHC